MSIRQGIEEKSRLGKLLVNRGYLSEQQVEEGLSRQRETGQRLGEILIQAGWLTERELHRVLRHQSRYRHAAALVTVVTLPFQPLVSFAATNTAQASQQATTSGEVYAGNPGQLAELTDSEMAGVTGQSDASLVERAQLLAAMASNPAGEQGDVDGTPVDAVEGLKFAANVFVPVLNFLDSDLTIAGVHYREGEPRYQMSTDGHLTLALPERIEQVRMENIRVAGSATAPLGTITLQDIRFDPRSSMTIYTR
ncbi:pilus assembly protein PilB [Marinobacter sp. C2H3]|uniref:pilus assembly protein PilB n=1 Tax=Marinobacter sp. C2H3 TaxID=3119003 RepID=UPI00300E8119